ncbi:unnamed protein product, partial [Aureobasidium pullulans]
VHADASNFDSNVSKQEAYAQVLEQARGLFFEQRNWQPLQRRLPPLALPPRPPLPQQPHKLDRLLRPRPSSPPTTQLILGPFQGKVACQTIRFGRGVCGVAAQTKTTQVVGDVEMFLATSPVTRNLNRKSWSLGIILADFRGAFGGEKQVVAIIDVDCAVKDAFDDEDKKALEELAQLIAESCDF